jgi:hypothetical protein
MLLSIPVAEDGAVHHGQHQLYKRTKGEVMFAIFRKRAGQLSADLEPLNLDYAHNQRS